MATIAEPVNAPGAPESSWRRTLSNAFLITEREVRDSFRDWRIIVPLVVLTFLFPFLAQFVAGQLAEVDRVLAVGDFNKGGAVAEAKDDKIAPGFAVVPTPMVAAGNAAVFGTNGGQGQVGK